MAEDASKKNYSYLHQLSTEELEVVLRASALSEEADDPDLVDHILEVIMQREKEKYDIQEVERARKDFDKLYRDLDEPLYPTAEIEASTAEPDEPSLMVSQTGKRRVKRILIAVAVIAALISLTCIPVFGNVSIIHMVAYWTAEQFGFYPEGQLPSEGNISHQSVSRQVPKEYLELQEVMQQYDSNLIIPIFPNDFEAGEPVLKHSGEFELVDFSIIYYRSEEFLIFDILYNGKQISNGITYEQNNPNVEYCIYANIKHYFLSNEDNNTVTWFIGKTEYSIVTNMPISELKKILETTYEV